jgi:hypothetical protein
MQTSVLPRGHPELITSDTARTLLAYTAVDVTPRVFPMMFRWTGEEIVFWTFAGARETDALRAQPDVAITIDTSSLPPQLLLLRGGEANDVDGIVSECRAAVAEVDRPGVRMATWIGVLDLTTRFPGGGTAEQFAQRG